MSVTTILLDNRNFDAVASALIKKIAEAQFIGLDTETQDSNRHDGLNAYCNYREDGTKAENSRTVFDLRRTVMTGFSIHVEGDDTAYYVNLNHADVANRLPWEKARTLLDAKTAGASWVAHNANYELSVFRSCYGLELDNYICTMQMAVSAFGPDEYPIDDFISIGQGGIKKLVPVLLQVARFYEPGAELPAAVADVVYKIIGKTTDSDFSYNGLVKSIAYGYGLKGLVKRFFNHQMTTFTETIGDKVHMGNLTGAEVAEYGADDAYWAIRLFHRLLNYMAVNCPETLDTFFTQENPMVREFSKIWTGGMKVNTDAIWSRRDEERANMATVLRTMKETVRNLLPFAAEPHEGLMADSWYAKGHAKYRKQIEDWANSKDDDDDFLQCMQVRGPVSNAWANDNGKTESTGPNFSHYMPIRVLIYDLAGTKVIKSQGKIQSDGESRGRLKDRFDKGNNFQASALIGSINQIAGVEQRMKLYLTPYTQLMDPETGKLYPTVSSMLASRRMGARTPNPMQLAKRGESTYVRGFFEADEEDHVIISVDWSSIELVEIGEFSQDPEFIKAYGQIPHDDLHAGAASDILAVEVPGLNEEIFKSLRRFDKVEDFLDNWGQDLANTNRLFTDLKGQSLGTGKAYKYWRTEVGKGANFNYWYSGFLGTIGERMGWSTEKTGQATDRYRSRFHVAEKWRTDLIEEGATTGRIMLEDGHFRTRFEATNRWMEYWMDKFMLQASREDDLAQRYNALIQFMGRKIQKRAHNQLVNSRIQGGCATIAKRSILRIDEKFKQLGWTDREARFMIPIHDELVFSVHKDLAVQGVNLIRDTMIDHPDMFKLCKLDASPSMGLTFEPWNAKSAPTGQVELYELPSEPGIGTFNGRATDDEIGQMVEYLFDQRKFALAA